MNNPTQSPKTIFLNTGQDEPIEDFSKLTDVTWSTDKISDGDVEYVRRDAIFEELPEKKLEWEHDKSGAFSDTLFGKYLICFAEGLWYAAPSFNDAIETSFETENEAKNFCQLHFTNLIKELLKP